LSCTGALCGNGIVELRHDDTDDEMIGRRLR
jgi:hypothetical protein